MPAVEHICKYREALQHQRAVMNAWRDVPNESVRRFAIERVMEIDAVFAMEPEPVKIKSRRQQESRRQEGKSCECGQPAHAKGKCLRCYVRERRKKEEICVNS